MYPNRLAEAAAIECGLFLICGGDGEREPEKKPEEGKPELLKFKPEAKADPKKGDKKSEGFTLEDDDDDEDDKEPELTPEEQLDALKRENLNLKKSNEQYEKGKKKTESEKEIAVQLTEAQEENASLKKLVNGKFLEWSVSTFKSGKTSYDWVDVEDVVNAIDHDAIKIDPHSGAIEGLDLELKRIAKKKPHWLKPEKGEEEQGDQPPNSGFHPRGAQKTTEEEDNARIAKKFKIPGIASQVQGF